MKLATPWRWTRGAYRRFDETGAVVAFVEPTEHFDRWFWSAKSVTDFFDYRDAADAQAKADAHLKSLGYVLKEEP